MSRFGRLVALTGIVTYAAFGVAACGDSIRETLGLGKQPPDEYRVVEHPPLVLPPDFHLRPPSPGAPRPQERATRDQAADILFGDEAAGEAASQQRTPGELSLLNTAGADEADPAIRQVIDRESVAPASEDTGILDWLMFWDEPEPEGVSIDPVAESDRLREDAAKRAPDSLDGPPTAEGENGAEDGEDSGLLDWLIFWD